MQRFESALDLAEHAARQVARVMGGRAELAELVSYGQTGLLEAARRYDPARGVPFRAYASYRVRGAIVDGVRSMASMPRRAYEKLRAYEAMTLCSEGASEDTFAPQPPGVEAAQAESALADHLGAMATAMAMGMLARPIRGEEGHPATVSAADTPEDALSRAEIMGKLRESIAQLPHPEGELLRRHYLEGERFDHIAQGLGLSKSWASRLHTRAVARLTKRLRNVVRD